MTPVTVPPPLPPPAASAPRKLSPLKWSLGVAMLMAVMFTCGGLPYFFGNRPPTAIAPNPVAGVLLAMLGVVIFACGAFVYGLVLLTACFTFNFTRPFFRTFGKKLWVANILTGLLLQCGVAFIFLPGVYPVLLRILPSELSWMAALFGPFIVAQVVMIWINVWGPLEVIVITRRLRARGVPPEQITAGRFVGNSNPKRNSWKKLGMIEEDLGMLWIGDDRLVYWGDDRAWEIRHDRFLGVDRKADSGSVASYFGTVHVIVRFLDAGGVEQAVRLHSEGDWTQTGKARASNQIADRLTAWHENPRAGWVHQPSGFAVQVA